MQGKTYWRCNVCNDVHFGINPPETCPTCGVKNAYCRIDEKEAAAVMGFEAKDAKTFDTKKRVSAWQEFAKKNDFKLNPDKKHVEFIIKGEQGNESKLGLKLCPCKIRDGTRERDLKLICPCNFKADDNWNTKGMCWCGLFVKK
jgi:ferredoxin-thioredoxin reductase catalytic subunit